MSELYFSGKYQNPYEVSFPIQIDITNAQDLQEYVAQSDYCFAKFNTGFLITKNKLVPFHRATRDFVSSEWLFVDIDNIQHPHLKIEQCNSLLAGIKYYITTSKSHNIRKDENEPTDRYHILFPLDRIVTDASEHKKMLLALHKQVFGCSVVDASCSDPSRMFFGNKTNSTYFFEGESIETRLNVSIEPERKKTESKIIDVDLKYLYTYLQKIAARTDHFNNYENILQVGFAMKASGYSEDDYLNLLPKQRIEQGKHIWDCGGEGFTIGTLIYIAKQVGFKITKGDVYEIIKKKNRRNY